MAAFRDALRERRRFKAGKHLGHIHPPEHFCGSNCPMNAKHKEPRRD